MVSNMIPFFVAFLCAQQPLILHEPIAKTPEPVEVKATDGPTSGYDGGFFLRSEDGANELVIEGLFQVVIGVFDPSREPSRDVELKRFRPEFAGRLARVLRFKFEPKFTADDVELEEAWIGAEFCGGNSILRIGRYKVPFGLEEVRSRRHIDFPTFSIINQFSPAEDHGIFVVGMTESGFLEYGLGAYNGTGGGATTGSQDVAARFMVHPLAGRTSNGELQLGVAATTGSQQEAIGGTFIEGGAGLDLVRFSPNVMLDGRRTRLGFESAWFNGPWFCQGELLHQTEEISFSGFQREVSYRGGYLTISRSLTGEAKTFRGVTPERPHDFEKGTGRGAWTTALRYSQLRLDPMLRFGFTEPGQFTSRIRTLSLALNWIPNAHVILRNALIYSTYSDFIMLPGGQVNSELTFLMEVQMHF